MKTKKELKQKMLQYLDDPAYEQAQNLLYLIVTDAFQAGWAAAGGEAPTPEQMARDVVGILRRAVEQLQSPEPDDIPDYTTEEEPDYKRISKILSDALIEAREILHAALVNSVELEASCYNPSLSLAYDLEPEEEE